MPSAFFRSSAFWRACCLVIVAFAVVAAVGLVLVSRPPLGSLKAARVLPVTLPNAVVPAPAVNDQEPAHSSLTASSRAPAPTAKGPRRRAREWEDRGVALAKRDPAAAFRALAELAPGADRNAMTRGIFEVLARGDAAQAIAYAKQTHPGVEREAALTTLLEGWNGPPDDGAPVRRAAFIKSAGLEAGLGLELLAGDPPRPDLAVLWAQELTAGGGKAQLLGFAASVQARTDPALAASYGSELTGEDQLFFNKQLVTSWAQTQPEAAWQYSSALADPAAREEAQNREVAAQSLNDPQGALARLTLLPDDDQRTETLKAVAANYAAKNLDAALAWAQTLPPAEMSVANDAISRTAPTGPGLRLAADDGYPTIYGLVPGSGLAQSGQIHEGDRIVGVSQGNNQFVDVQHLDLNEVAKLVRGAAGSVLQLQIMPALPGGGYGAPTEVSIIRHPTKQGGG